MNPRARRHPGGACRPPGRVRGPRGAAARLVAIGSHRLTLIFAAIVAVATVTRSVQATSGLLLLTRGAAWLIAYWRRERDRDRADDLAVEFLRAVASEVALGRGAAEALCALSDDRRLTGLGCAIVGRASWRIRCGDGPDEALAGAFRNVTGADAGPGNPMAVVAAAMALDARGEGAVGLRRLSGALEEATRSRRRARAGMTEARFVASSVPMIAAAMGLLLWSTDGRVRLLLASYPGILLAVGCWGIALTTLAVLLRHTRLRA